MPTNELSNSGRSIPWRRTMVEGIAITLSILLAFSIDAGWEKFKERKQETAFLQSLLRDFKQTRARIDESISRHQNSIEQARPLLDLQAEEASAIEPEVLEEMLSNVFLDWTSLYVSNGSLEALFASGDIEIIGNETLRGMLAAWPSQVADAREDEVWIANSVGRSLAPYLHTKVHTRNVSRQSIDEAAETIPQLESVDYGALWGDPLFDNLVASRILDEIYAILDISRLGQDADAIIRVLEAELGQ